MKVDEYSDQVTYEEISKLMPPLWNSGREIFWLKKVWSILEKKGLTKYADDKEYFHVQLMAVSACAIYIDFCNRVLNCYESFSELYQNAENLLREGNCPSSMDRLSFYAGRFADEDFPIDGAEIEDVIGQLELAVRPDVLDGIQDELPLDNMAVGMYYTGNKFPIPCEYDDETEEEKADRKEVEDATESCDAFWDYVDNHLQELISFADFGELMTGYSWLSDGAPRLGEYWGGE